MDAGTVAIEAIVKGWVQGVGFRATTKRHAERLGLVGTVRNLPDGSVKIEVVGKRADVELLLQILKSNAGAADVSEIQKREFVPKQNYTFFEIL